MQESFAERAFRFFSGLTSPRAPDGISILNPYKNGEVLNAVSEFLEKFFNDNNPRVFLLGINPGRFGGGITGISFTDPVALREFCGIKNDFGNRRELSSTFVYEVIQKYGGCKKFYSKFFLSAVYPLALIKDGKNFNYYDSPYLFEKLKPELIRLLKKQIAIGAKRNAAISFGKKNAEFLERINREINLFEKIIQLEHPRFIMQYRRKKKEEFVEKYINVLRQF